ncbi:MAG: hypothetical protein AAB091_03600 [Elusimicrobiota bacterium]
MKDFQHIAHLAILFVFVIAAFFIGRILLVPKSFGKIGHYRADAIKEVRALPIRYAGQEACKDCHGAIFSAKISDGHKKISCESCHGAGGSHVENPADAKPSKPSEKQMREFCGVCHSQNISRPRNFPQVDMYAHNPGLSCNGCHDPHKPKL